MIQTSMNLWRLLIDLLHKYYRTKHYGQISFGRSLEATLRNKHTVLANILYTIVWYENTVLYFLYKKKMNS